VTLSGAAGKDGMLTVRVADRGRGIPDDKADLIFERFKQVDAADAREKGGSGLGLAICRSIVNAHGGRIWTEKNGEQGSLFLFTVPLNTPVPVPRIPEIEPADERIPLAS
jgi:signal transduction histidine kinase